MLYQLSGFKLILILTPDPWQRRHTMNNDKKQNSTAEASGVELTADALKGKQSVRATFRLPAHIINLLSIAASQLGLKQKSLLDQLVEDRTILNQVADEARKYKPAQKEQRQKTFVLSRHSLVSLESVSKKYRMPRDVLVEVSIKRLMPVINAEQERQEKRKVVLRDMEVFFDHGMKVLRKAGRLLGTDDPVFQRMECLVKLCGRNISEIHDLVEKGKCMEKFR